MSISMEMEDVMDIVDVTDNVSELRTQPDVAENAQHHNAKCINLLTEDVHLHPFISISETKKADCDALRINSSTENPLISDSETNEAASSGLTRNSSTKHPSSSAKRTDCVRFRVRTSTIPEDGYTWRKYGEKPIRNHKFSRSYFRCASPSCPAKKSVQRDSDDGDYYSISYSSGHTHDRSDNLHHTSIHSSSFGDAVVGQANVGLPLREVCLTLSVDGIREGGHNIDVGVRVHLFPPEKMEFFFFNQKDMATCVGVGLPYALVVLDKNFQVVVHEWSEAEWKAEKLFWIHKRKLGVSDSVMTFTQDRKQIQHTNKPRAMVSSVHGIGFDTASQYIDESLDYREDSWAILHEMAFFIMTESMAVRLCTVGSSGKIKDSPFNVHPRNNRQQQVNHGKNKRAWGDEQGGGGDGDGDEEGDSSGAALEGNNDDIPIVLRVIVHPRSKDSVFDELLDLEVELPCDGLEGASVASELVFDFLQNRECRRISITASTRLQLVSDNSLIYNNSERFGWYHNEIEMNLSCLDLEDAEFGRTAVLRHSSCKMLNPITSSKYVVANTGALSLGHEHSGEGHVDVGIGGVVKLQGALNSSRSKEETTTTSQTIEMTRDSICGGFYPIDCSRSESPACARFKLIYPLDCFDLWLYKGFLKSQGLFATIEPKLTGTWIPLNDVDASPYLFRIDRKLKLHWRSSQLNCNDTVRTYNQNYILSFYINHAMTHLRRERGQHVELHGDPQQVPRVLKVARVF